MRRRRNDKLVEAPRIPHKETDAFEFIIKAGEAINKARDLGRDTRALNIARTHLETAMLWLEWDLRMKHAQEARDHGEPWDKFGSNG